MNARVEPAWIEQQAAHLVKRRWFDPHWSRKDGRVMAYEQVTLFGLTLVEKRRVAFERVDPAEARRVFIRAALVTGDVDCKATFVRDNAAVLAAARDEEAKRRRRGLVADDETLAQWLEPRIPDGVASAAALDAWWKGLAPEARRALVWTLADVLDVEAGGEAQFPEKLDVLGRRLALEYRFEPGHPADGVTLKLPLELLNAVPGARLSWLVPGFRAELVAELIRGLPKALRRNFVPAPDFARAFCAAVAPDDGPLTAALARWLARVTGVEVPPDAWDLAALPAHLRMNVRLLDEQRRPLADGRDLDALREEHGARARREFARTTATTLARSGLVKFDFDALPASVTTDAGLAAFPALVDEGASVAIKVFERADEAATEHAKGVLKLLRLALADRLRQAKKQLPLAPRVAIAYTAVDSPERLRDDLVEAALDDLARARVAAVRRRADFDTLVAELGRTLFAAAVERLKHVEAILEGYAALAPRLTPPLLGYGKASYDDLRAQLAGLVHPGFARALALERLAEVPRYVKAMGLRVDRLVNDARKDQARMLEVLPFVDALAKLRRTHPDDPRVERLRWLVEEFRVQLFAQELKTKEAVSDKRLRKLVEGLGTT
jgi:ATP-dependent helicase HrpA